jgi:hypothetical protein
VNLQKKEKSDEKGSKKSSDALNISREEKFAINQKIALRSY